MRYLMLEFSFPTPQAGIEPTIESQKAVLEAVRIVDLKLRTAGIPALHAYAWPGQPLYIYVHTTLNDDQLDDLFPRLITSPKIIRVYEYKPDEEYKQGLTFKQAFDAQMGQQ